MFARLRFAHDFLDRLDADDAVRATLDERIGVVALGAPAIQPVARDDTAASHLVEPVGDGAAIGGVPSGFHEAWSARARGTRLLRVRGHQKGHHHRAAPVACSTLRGVGWKQRSPSYCC